MSGRIVLCTLLLITLFACQQQETKGKVASYSSVEPANMVIHGGKILTMDKANSTAEAIAIRDGGIAAVGTFDEIQPYIGKDTRVIELENELVVPGFIEAHGHLMGTGSAHMTIRLEKARNWQQIVTTIGADLQVPGASLWVLGRGWHQEKWDKAPERTVAGYPTHHGLSAVSPNHAVLLRHASGHAVFANAKAMELAGIDDDTPNPPGGEIIRDENGHATGVFTETAEALVNRAYRKWEAEKTDLDRLMDRNTAITLAVQDCISKGITSFQDAGSSFADIDLIKKIEKESGLKMRLWVMIGEGNEALAERGEEYAAYQSPYLTVGGIKRYIDGALGSRGAWLLEPYRDAPDSTGQKVMSLEALRETAKLAKTLGLQLCTHAIGDRGNREVLNIYEDFVRGEDLRWRIEHAQHLHPDDIPRFGELGVIASMQGIHCTSDAPFVATRLGDTRAEQGAYVWRKLLDSGAKICNGTDTPVEDVDPIANIYALVTRQPKSGEPFYPAQALTVEEALRAYTIDNAYAVFKEKQKGSLEPGKFADITILSQDITQVPVEEIPGTKVVYTIMDGVIRYQPSDHPGMEKP